MVCDNAFWSVDLTYLHECWARRADTFDRYTRSTPTYPFMGYTNSRKADSQYPRIYGLACHPFSPPLPSKKLAFPTSVAITPGSSDLASLSEPTYDCILRSSRFCSASDWRRHPPSSHTGSSSSPAPACHPSISPPPPRPSARRASSNGSVHVPWALSPLRATTVSQRCLKW